MDLAWKVMIPLALVNLVCVMVVQRVRTVAVVLLTASIVADVRGGGGDRDAARRSDA